MELICQMEIASELGYISSDDYFKFTGSAKVLSIKLSNYNNAIRRKENNNS